MGKKFQNIQFNEPIYITPKNKFLYPLSFSFKWLILNKMPSVADKIYQINTNCRIVELPFVYENIEGKGIILDAGCYESKLSIELASRGCEVWGIDLRRYPLTHPNFNFICGDICKMPFPDNFFDEIISISTIEHIGIGAYKDPIYSDGDKKAIKEMIRVLKRERKMIITVPFGEKAITWYRVYDFSSLKELLAELKIEKIEFSAMKEGNWVPVSLNEAENIDSSKGVKGVALIVARKECE